MPENEFEKKVQQRMEELRFTPSDEVWKEVEHRIRKEKKKRRFIFWLPLLFLLLGGGLVTAIWVADNDGNHIAKSDRRVNKLQPNHPLVQSRPENNTSFSKGNIEKAITPKKETGKNIIKENAGNYLKKSFIFGKRSLPENKSLVKDKGTELNQPVIKEIIADIVAKNSPDKQNNVPEVKDNTNFNQPVNQQNDSTVSTEIAGRKNDKPEIQKQNNESIKDSIANAATEEKKPIHLNKKSMKWQWGIMMEKGRSQVADGFKLFDNKAYADNTYANSASPGSGNPVYTPSEIRPSGSIGAGVFIERSISKRFDINLGLSYLYLSTKMNVGNRVDSSRVISNSFSSSVTVDNFYRASNSNSSYTNHYHFLSLSAELSWKIIDSKTIPVYWNNGFSYGRLLSSNALHFDRNIPGYYKDFGLLTHNHFFLSTGFSVPVFKWIIINPFAKYSLTPVLRNTGSSRTHFTNYGVGINFFLKNKK
jgi:hypothetical protein